MEWVQLVDERDKELGIMEKMAAHKAAALHRAISVFIFNSKGEMLLQQRAAQKYHSGLLWTNTCCTHPRPGEDLLAAAQRRLSEEMGLHCLLHHQFSFLYKADLDDGMTEHEYDHVYFGYTDDVPQANPDEVAAWAYRKMEDIAVQLAEQPALFTEWFKLIFIKLKRAAE
ncbi:MAG TPA: isopentenyl-diphosphate Delta-isomerase [Chitinophagaceae bacterium]|nr:isopentenyl-diphosphate Delta-isomerase [Chitinophagaceae bacterium]